MNTNGLPSQPPLSHQRALQTDNSLLRVHLKINDDRLIFIVGDLSMNGCLVPHDDVNVACDELRDGLPLRRLHGVE